MWLVEDMDSSGIDSMRTTYEKVFGYLEFSGLEDLTPEWDERYEEQLKAEARDEAGDEEDDSWRESSSSRPSRTLADIKDENQIDAMFKGLNTR
jgi:hypothetical protein